MKKEHIVKKKGLIARLMDHAGPHGVTMILSWVFSALSGVLSLGPYICIYFVARELVVAGGDFSSLDTEVMIGYGWLAVCFTGISFFAYGIGLLCSHVAAFSLMANMRIKILRRLGDLPLSFHSNNPSGKLRKIIERNTENMENYVAHQLPDTAQAVMMPIVFLASMFYFDWRLAIICLIPVAFGFVVLASMLKEESTGFLKSYQKSLGDMSNAAVEYVRGIAVVKVFGQTVYSFKRFHDSIMTYRKFVTQYALSMEKPMSLYTTAVHGIFFVLIPGGIILYSFSQSLESFVFSFVFFIVLTPLIAAMLMRIMSSSSNRMIAEQALDAIEVLLDEKPMDRPKDPKTPSTYDITFDSVSFRYEKDAQKAIDNLSFRAPTGTVTALVGASGGGKTTVANLIARFWDVDSGSICVGGVDVRAMDQDAWLDRIAFVFQDTELFKMSIAQNVAFSAPDATEREIEEALHKAQCDDILAKLPEGMHTVLGTKGVYVSGGEMQRIALARAILKDAPVLLLDEATAFADPENEYKIQKALNILMEGKTVLMIAHRLSTITEADQILVLEEGALVESGTHEALMEREGSYYTMYNEYQAGTAWKIRGAAHA